MSSDKSYSAELRLNQLWNHLGPAPAGTGNGQRQTLVSTSDQVVNFTSDGTLGGGVAFTFALGNGLWRITGNITWTQGAGAVTQAMGFTGSGGLVTSHVRINSNHFKTGAGSSSQCDDFTTLGGGQTVVAFTAGNVQFWWFRGIIAVTTPGSLNVVGHCNGTNTFSVNSYSDVTAETVGQTS